VVKIVYTNDFKTDDGLRVLEEGFLVGPYIAVKLSDGTHRILRQYLKHGEEKGGFKIFNFWKGLCGVINPENSDIIQSLICSSKYLPRLEWSAGNSYDLYIRVRTDEGNYFIVCMHTPDGLDECGIFLFKEMI